MYYKEAIIRSILEKSYRPEELFTKARNHEKMSKDTFNKHLKPFIENGYILKIKKNKISTYEANQKKIAILRQIIDKPDWESLLESDFFVNSTKIELKTKQIDSVNRLITYLLEKISGLELLLSFHEIDDLIHEIISHELDETKETLQELIKKLKVKQEKQTFILVTSYLKKYFLKEIKFDKDFDKLKKDLIN